MIKLPKRNMEIINAAIKAMQRKPKSVDMDDWIQHDETVAGKEPYCGTAACIAGHIAIAATGRIGDKENGPACPPTPDFYEEANLPKWLRGTGYGEFTDSQRIARRVLRIDPDDFNLSESLFLVEEWPTKFRQMYQKNKAKGTIARLRYWLKNRDKVEDKEND